jgi:hypothetical protein
MQKFTARFSSTMMMPRETFNYLNELLCMVALDERLIAVRKINEACKRTSVPSSSIQPPSFHPYLEFGRASCKTRKAPSSKLAAEILQLKDIEWCSRTVLRSP